MFIHTFSLKETSLLKVTPLNILSKCYEKITPGDLKKRQSYLVDNTFSCCGTYSSFSRMFYMGQATKSLGGTPIHLCHSTVPCHSEQQQIHYVKKILILVPAGLATHWSQGRIPPCPYQRLVWPCHVDHWTFWGNSDYSPCQCYWENIPFQMLKISAIVDSI